MYEKKEFNTKKLNKYLLITIFSLAGLILVMTLIGVITQKAVPGKNLRKAEPIPQVSEEVDVQPFAGLGRIRASTKPKDGSSTGSPVIISPWFNYPADDKVFFEELSKKSTQIKNLISSYFSKDTKEYFQKIKESKIKEDLLEIINSHLVLGKLDSLYFSEFIFLD